MMNDYKPNSHAYREEQKKAPADRKVEKVVKGAVKAKKKSEVRKFTDVFISEDAANVKSYILMDVLIPTIKETIVDIIKDSVDMIFLGGTGRSGNKHSRGSTASYVSYRDYSRRDDRRRHESSRSDSRFDLDELIFASKGDAEAVLEQMENIIDDYGMVRVSDLYDLADLSAPYTGNRYGWTSLRNAYSERVRGGGYILRLPKPMVID